MYFLLFKRHLYAECYIPQCNMSKCRFAVEDDCIKGYDCNNCPYYNKDNYDGYDYFDDYLDDLNDGEIPSDYEL